MNDKRLGKIESATFGMGGYQEAMIGISFTLSGSGWGVCDFWGYWGIPVSERTKWTHEERVKYLGDVVMRVHQLLKDSGKQSIDKLKGIPIEVEFDGNTLKYWRVLKEVL